MSKKTVLAIIGGSGLYSFAGLSDTQTHDVSTPYGKPSDTILSGKVGDVDVLFLARHGRNHSILPSEVNYQANIYALKTLGAEWCVGVGAVGSLKEEYPPGHIVIPDQSLDWTKGRKGTFFGEGLVAHVSFAEPFCPVLRSLLLQSAKETLSHDIVHDGGTHICIEGPLFSSKAESHLYRSMGAVIIGMTNMPEAKLAREAEISYAGLNLVTDYDCWKENEEAVEVSKVMKVLKENAHKANTLLLNLMTKISATQPSDLARNALSSALVTQFNSVSKERLNDLKPLIERYQLNFAKN